MKPSDPIAAATLVLFRAAESGPPELLFVERARGMVFAAGALVFPGGRVDPDDHALAAAFSPLDPEDAAARVAAIRETLEETGLAIGFDQLPGATETAAMRAALAAGEAFSAILKRAGYRLDPAILMPWARWCPNFHETRNFDTRFYIAHAPEGASPPSVDQTENVHLFWATAQQVLDRAASGAAVVIFPTRRNLERLAMFSNFETAAGHAAETPLQLIQPWTEMRDGEEYLCIPEGLGYPVTSDLLKTLRRG